MTKMYKEKRRKCCLKAEKTEKEKKEELRERALFIVQAIDEQLKDGNEIYTSNSLKSNDFGYGVELPSISELEKIVLEYIIGQDTQVRQIITAIYRARCFRNIKSNILIIGKSGTGKTETIKQIANRLNIPYTIEDATKYTQEGYEGANVNDMIYNLLESADYDIEKAQNGILVIDEIDKKAGSGIANDVSGSEVLKSLLKIIEGTTIILPDRGASAFSRKTLNFRTNDLIIIFSGAFSGVEKIRDKRLNKNKIGFSNEEPISDKNSRILKQDLIKYGMTEEFVSRVDTIVEMNNLSEEDLIEILKRSRLSIFRRYKNEFKRKGIKLTYTRDLFYQIAENSLALDTGARELSNTVNYIFENIIYDILSNPGKFRNCKLLKGIVTDNTKYILS